MNKSRSPNYIVFLEYNLAHIPLRHCLRKSRHYVVIVRQFSQNKFNLPTTNAKIKKIKIPEIYK